MTQQVEKTMDTLDAGIGLSVVLNFSASTLVFIILGLLIGAALFFRQVA